MNGRDFPKENNRLSSVLVALGVILIAAAAGLTVFNLNQSNEAGKTAAQTVRELREAIGAEETARRDESAGSGAQQETQLPDYKLNPEMEMPVVRIGYRDYIGTLSIPALGLELPVISSWDYSALRVAPCRYTGSVYMDDMVIAAHNYASHFGRLRELSPGDSVVFTDMDGNVFDYVVADLEILDPYDIDRMTAGGWALTLFTCTPGGQQRVTLRCDRA